jgi:hypothetical protein
MNLPKDDYDVPEWRREFNALPKIPILDGEEWEMMRLIDETSSKESRLIIVTQLPHQDDSAKG